MTFTPLGDHAVVVTLGASVDDAVLERVRSLVSALGGVRTAGFTDIVAAYATVTVFYEPRAVHPLEGVTRHDEVCRVIRECVARSESSWPGLLAFARRKRAERTTTETTEIPVCYGGECGADLGTVAQHCGLPEAEVIALHAGADYQVHAVGFSPGFPYLGGLPGKLRTPRRSTPRTEVPAGSVGIGWTQTGVYPLASPGGWQLIGRTPLALFEPQKNPPALLRVGDRVKFKAITPEEFAAWK